jgi:hypothetical protein
MEPHIEIKAIPIHATLPVKMLRVDPLPWCLPQVPLRQQLDDFYSIYLALSADVEVLDPNFSSKYSREILRLGANIATAFRIQINADCRQDTNDNGCDHKAQVEFARCLASLVKAVPKSTNTAVDMEPVEGQSGATIVDYMVALMAINSPSLKGPLRGRLDTW